MHTDLFSVVNVKQIKHSIFNLEKVHTHMCMCALSIPILTLQCKCMYIRNALKHLEKYDRIQQNKML